MTPGARTGLRIVGTVVAIVMVLSFATSAVSRMVRHTEQTSYELSAEVSEVSITTEVGEVDVRAVAEGEPLRAVARITSGLRDPSVQVSEDGGRAVLSSSCAFSLLDDTCEVSWEVQVPVDAAVRVQSSVGDVTIADTSGPVSVRSSVGSVALTGVSGGQLDVDSSVGDIDVHTAGPVPGMDVTSSTGDVDIAVGDDSGYQVRTDTSLGEVTNELGSDSSAERVIRVETSVGDIHLRRSVD